jgi:hypothetical protein
MVGTTAIRKAIKRGKVKGLQYDIVPQLKYTWHNPDLVTEMAIVCNSVGQWECDEDGESSANWEPVDSFNIFMTIQHPCTYNMAPNPLIPMIILVLMINYLFNFQKHHVHLRASYMSKKKIIEGPGF